MTIHRSDFAVRHELQRITLELVLTSKPSVQYRATGTSSGKLKALWLDMGEHTEDVGHRYTIDHLSHVLQIALVHKPRRQEDLERLLRGGTLYEDQAMF